MRTGRSGSGAAIPLLLMLAAAPAVAQFPEDALRFATPGPGIGARALGMGNAYTGVANDFSALYWNPAGLAQMQYGEFSFGLSQLNHRNTSTFFDEQVSSSNNTTALNSLGLALPVEVRRGSLVFGFGFQRHGSYTTGLEFEGFNPFSSIIQAYAADSTSYPSNITLPEELKLAIADTNTGLFNSPIRDRVLQAGQVLEGGGVNHWSFGGAIDIARNLSVGATLTYASGSYTYDRTYTERDARNVYAVFPFDFDELTIDDYVESDLSGFGATLGLLYRDPERFRFGVAVKTPMTYAVNESYSTTARATFDNNDVAPADGPYVDEGGVEYDVVTPWVFSAGASAIVLRDLLLSADIEFTDWTQTEFADAPSTLIAKNKEIKRLFRATANLRGGLEYNIRDLGVRLRGGFLYAPSPFSGDPSEYDRKTATGGLGFLLGETTMLDLAYAHSWWRGFRSNYDGPSVVNEDIKTNTVFATFSYRF